MMWRKPLSGAGVLGGGDLQSRRQSGRERADFPRSEQWAVGGRIVARVSPKSAGSQLLLNMATLLRPAPSCLYLAGLVYLVAEFRCCC